jgi:hypothetical protein
MPGLFIPAIPVCYVPLPSTPFPTSVRTVGKNIHLRPCVPRILLLHAAPPDTFGTYHDAVVAELVDAQR